MYKSPLTQILFFRVVKYCDVFQVIESMPARRTEGITFYYDADASGQEEQEDKQQNSADESSSGCLTGFDESIQGEHSGHDLTDSIHNQV